MFQCGLCGFTTENGRVMSNHKRWVHRKIAFSEEALKRKAQAALSKRISKSCTCAKCGKQFILTLRQCDWNRRDLDKICCSKTCSHARTWDTKHKQRLSSIMLNKMADSSRILPNCLFCGHSVKRKDHKFCSISCAVRYRNKDKDQESLAYYRNLCRFTFDIYDYPEEFDFNLIDTFGWYSPVNRGNNLRGISKDHLVSVKFGWENKIDPKIISHPANCQLVKQSKNASKNYRCSITLKELTQRIYNWNIKYGAVV